MFLLWFSKKYINTSNCKSQFIYLKVKAIPGRRTIIKPAEMNPSCAFFCRWLLQMAPAGVPLPVASWLDFHTNLNTTWEAGSLVAKWQGRSHSWPNECHRSMDWVRHRVAIEPEGRCSNGPSPLTGSGWTQACCTVVFPAVSKEWMKKSAVRGIQVSNKREVWLWWLHSELRRCHQRAGVPGSGSCRWEEGAPQTVHPCFHLFLREHLFNLSSDWNPEPLLWFRRHLALQLPDVCEWVCECTLKQAFQVDLVGYSKEQPQYERICFGFGVKQNRPR